MKSTALQIAILVVAATVIAVVANGFAPRQRRLVLPGYYPNAQRIPPREPERVPPPPVTTTTPMATATIAETATVAQSPAPGQPPIAIPTATIERPAGAPDTTTQAAATPAPPTPAPPTPTPAPLADPLARFAPHPDKPYVEISGDDVMALYKAGVLFLDARRTSVYEEGHIAGARSYSVWEGDIDDKVSALFNERMDPREQALPIVIYCSGGACEDSHMLAQKLWGAEFNNVYVYKDGYPDWLNRGGATRSGQNP